MPTHMQKKHFIIKWTNNSTNECVTSISQITRERLVVKGECQSYPPMESIIKGMISYNLKWFCKTFSRGSVEKHLMMPSQNYNIFCNDIRLHMWLWFYRDCHLCPSTDRVYNVKSTKGKQNSNTKANLELRNVNKASQENRVSSLGYRDVPLLDSNVVVWENTLLPCWTHLLDTHCRFLKIAIISRNQTPSGLFRADYFTKN